MNTPHGCLRLAKGRPVLDVEGRHLTALYSETCAPGMRRD